MVISVGFTHLWSSGMSKHLFRTTLGTSVGIYIDDGTGHSAERPDRLQTCWGSCCWVCWPPWVRRLSLSVEKTTKSLQFYQVNKCECIQLSLYRLKLQNDYTPSMSKCVFVSSAGWAQILGGSDHWGAGCGWRGGKTQLLALAGMTFLTLTQYKSF